MDNNRCATCKRNLITKTLSSHIKLHCFLALFLVSALSQSTLVRTRGSLNTTKSIIHYTIPKPLDKQVDYSFGQRPRRWNRRLSESVSSSVPVAAREEEEVPSRKSLKLQSYKSQYINSNFVQAVKTFKYNKSPRATLRGASRRMRQSLE